MYVLYIPHNTMFIRSFIQMAVSNVWSNSKTVEIKYKKHEMYKYGNKKIHIPFTIDFLNTYGIILQIYSNGQSLF